LYRGLRQGPQAVAKAYVSQLLLQSRRPSGEMQAESDLSGAETFRFL